MTKDNHLLFGSGDMVRGDCRPHACKQTCVQMNRQLFALEEDLCAVSWKKKIVVNIVGYNTVITMRPRWDDIWALPAPDTDSSPVFLVVSPILIC